MSLRSTLGELIRSLPNEVIEIDNEVSIEHEITAYAETLSSTSPVLLFKKIKHYPSFRLVSNIFSSRSKIALYLGVKEEQLNERWSSIINRNVNYEVRKGPSSRELVFTEDKVDITTLPAPLHYLQDAGRYITSGMVVARDLSGKVNLSFARMQILGPRLVAISMHSRGHLWSYYQQYRKQGKNLPVSVIIGAHPIYYLLAAARVEEEYSKISGLIDDYLVSGITNDLPVPANAEIVMEGEISSSESFNEGPFTEYTGYLSNRSTNNVARISAITMRKDPIYLEINPSNSKEHILMSGIAKEPIVHSTIRNFLPSAYSFSVQWPLKGVHYVAFAGIENAEPGIAKQLGLMLLGLDHYLKLVFVSEDSHPSGLYDLLSQMLCYHDIEVMTEVFCNRLDPSASSDGTSSKAVIITKENSTSYRIREVEDGINIYRCGKSLHVGRVPNNSSEINLLVDRDINPADEEEVLWAIATRLQPAGGIRTLKNGLVIDSKRKGLNRPQLPGSVLEKVRQSLHRIEVHP
jgi:4-hydroxy-3-polyprenylbenzoate decarboxylase